MAAVKTFSRSAALAERSTYQYQVTLKNVDGDEVAPADVTQIYLSLRDLRTDVIVNDREMMPVKNINGGTLTEGLFTFQFSDEDLKAIGEETLQPRLMTIDVRLLGGGRMTREIVFWIKAMQDIEAA